MAPDVTEPLTPALSQRKGEPVSLPVGQLMSRARIDLTSAGADSPWLTALTLLEHATGLSRAALLARPEWLPTSKEVADFQGAIRRRCEREPLAYIVGYREFYGRRFAVSRATLIPRPETEALVELALDHVGRMGDPSPTLLDVGTGSGAIAISVLAERPSTSATVTDTSLAALAIAADNAQAHGADRRLRPVACDLASAIRTTFPLVVANLPYIPAAELDLLQPEVSKYEPRLALDGGPDGLVIIRRFLASLDRILAPDGVAFLEFGDGQAKTLVRDAGTLVPGCRVDVRPDAAGVERILVVERLG
jgi:release factor glutamine methyltransferase